MGNQSGAEEPQEHVRRRYAHPYDFFARQVRVGARHRERVHPFEEAQINALLTACRNGDQNKVVELLGAPLEEGAPRVPRAVILAQKTRKNRRARWPWQRSAHADKAPAEAAKEEYPEGYWGGHARTLDEEEIYRLGHTREPDPEECVVQSEELDALAAMLVNQSNLPGTLFPLSMAAREGQVEVARMLVEDYGACVRQRSKDGVTALYAAAQHDRPFVVELLLKHEAKVNEAARGGMTPLCVAAHMGHAAVMRLLIDAGAEVNYAIPRSLCTPLHHAALQDHREAVRVLLSSGADHAQRNDEQYTAEQYARVLGSNSAARFIERWRSHYHQQVVFMLGLRLVQQRRGTDSREDTAALLAESALFRYSRATTFDLNNVGMIFELLDGRDHLVDRSLRAKKKPEGA